MKKALINPIDKVDNKDIEKKRHAEHQKQKQQQTYRQLDLLG